MSRGARVAWAVVWGVLVMEAVVLSPPARADQNAWVFALLTGDWAGEEPLVVALFQLMGVWPFVLAAQLSSRLRRRPVPLWPFVLVSMGIGAFGLLPGLVIGGTAVAPAWWQRWLRHPLWLGVLALSALGLVGWAAMAGDPSRFGQAFTTDQFVHVMTLDFAALWLTSVLVAREGGGRWAYALVPVFGGLLWARRDGHRP